MFDFLKRMYDEGRIDKDYLNLQLEKGRINEEEYEKIINGGI